MQYLKTLTIEPRARDSYERPVDMVEFYRMALAPYKQLAGEIGRRKEIEAELEKRKAVIGRDDRQGLKTTRHESIVKANTGDKFVDAFIDEVRSVKCILYLRILTAKRNGEKIMVDPEHQGPLEARAMIATPTLTVATLNRMGLAGLWLETSNHQAAVVDGWFKRPSKALEVN